MDGISVLQSKELILEESVWQKSTCMRWVMRTRCMPSTFPRSNRMSNISGYTRQYQFMLDNKAVHLFYTSMRL